jgi:hypothetical protein
VDRRSIVETATRKATDGGHDLVPGGRLRLGQVRRQAEADTAREHDGGPGQPPGGDAEPLVALPLAGGGRRSRAAWPSGPSAAVSRAVPGQVHGFRALWGEPPFSLRVLRQMNKASGQGPYFGEDYLWVLPATRAGAA